MHVFTRHLAAVALVLGLSACSTTTILPGPTPAIGWSSIISVAEYHNARRSGTSSVSRWTPTGAPASGDPASAPPGSVARVGVDRNPNATTSRTGTRYRRRPRTSSSTNSPTSMRPRDARVKVSVSASDWTSTAAHQRIRSRRSLASIARPAVTMIVRMKIAPRKLGEMPSVPAIRPGTSK